MQEMATESSFGCWCHQTDYALSQLHKDLFFKKIWVGFCFVLLQKVVLLGFFFEMFLVS